MNLPLFVEEADYEKGFASHYDKEIRPALEELESQRMALLNTFKKKVLKFLIIPWTTIVFLGALIAFKTGESYLITTVAYNSLLVFIPLALYMSHPLWKYKVEVKSKILPLICSFFGQLTYKNKAEIDESILALEIFPSYETASVEDSIEGNYKDLNLKIFELILKIHGRKKSRTTFQGLVLIVNHTKDFQAKTLVTRDLGGLGNWIEQPKGLERIHLEDPDFENRFEVHGNNQVEARYLLTTAFMERLLKLSQTPLGRGIRCEFVNKQVVLTLRSNKNILEPNSVLQSTLSLKTLHLFLAQMNEIFSLIDALKIQR